MIRTAIITAALLFAGAASATDIEARCASVASLSVAALEARQDGVTEAEAMDYLRHQGVYSGLPVWAVKQAYKSPADVPAWMLRGAVFRECRERMK